MSLKYCFNSEIHKKYEFPPDFASLVQDIKSVFLQKLPSNFMIRYQDTEEDQIVVSNDAEYQAMIKHECGNSERLANLKLHIIPLEDPKVSESCNKNPLKKNISQQSFEVVSDDSLKVEEIVDVDSSTEEAEKTPEAEIVVSLPIPKTNTSRALGFSEADQQSFRTISDMPEEISLSLEEENMPERQVPVYNSSFGKRSDNSEEGDVSVSSDSSVQKSIQHIEREKLKITFNKELDQSGTNSPRKTRFRKWLESPSFKEERSPSSRKSPRRFNSLSLGEEQNSQNKEQSEVQNQSQEGRRSQSMSQYLSRSLSRVAYEQESPRKNVSLALASSQDINYKELNQFLEKLIEKKSFLVENPAHDFQIKEDDYFKEEEEEAEKWLSFEADNTERIYKAPYLKPSFGLKNFQENWFGSHSNYQEKSDRYHHENNKQRAFGDDWMLEDFGASFAHSANKSKKTKFMVQKKQSFFPVKDEEFQEKRGRYKNLRLEIDDKENIDENIPEVKGYAYDANVKIDNYLKWIENSEEDMDKEEFPVNLSLNMHFKMPEKEHRNCENADKLTLSPIAISEVQHMASAIGSMQRIAPTKNLPIFDIPSPQNPSTVQPQKHPLNEWATSANGEKGWSFKRNNLWKDNKNWFTSQNKNPSRDICNNCREAPISGTRYMCLVCEDIQYCEKCEPQVAEFHPLLKIEDGNQCHSHLGGATKPALPSQKEDFFQAEEEFQTSWKSFENSNDFGPEDENGEADLEYNYEYVEIANMPIMIKSRGEEWRVIYKNIYLKNTGSKFWRRCIFEPVGSVMGKISEISWVEPGDSSLLTLEIYGFFAPGKYTSTWKIVHKSDTEPANELGYISLDFEVVQQKEWLAGDLIY